MKNPRGSFGSAGIFFAVPGAGANRAGTRGGRWVRTTLLGLLLGLHAVTPSMAEEPQDARLLVFKKWIGASGTEPDVEIHLFCRQGEHFPELRLNAGQPAEWLIRNLPAEGIFCSVFEVERETFMADDEDCRDLLVVPGRDAECTVVNTKLVKRIDMLNRFGLSLMIVVMLGAGLAAVYRRNAGPA